MSDHYRASTVLPFSEMSEEEISRTLKTYKIGLTVDEARKIGELLGRDPTLTEAVIWGIQGSEHCSYKSSRRFLRNFLTKGKHIILGPVEDSGIVAITDGPDGKRWGCVVTHESHNHPSQIVPFEGAATGIGGTVRDVVCMGARVIGCMDMLRLGDLQTDESRTIAREVIRGIAGYGNPLGVPNLGGDTVFDSSYNSNCLVNAVAVGIVREDEVIHSMVPDEAGDVGYDIILIGKPTDRSGFGGASFASASMEEDKKEQNSGAVQEPNPFLERHLLASTYALFDWLAAEKKLDKVSFKDLGAGGVVCASVEQVADKGMGAEIDLDRVHTATDTIPPEVIACAETQERLCWTCHPSLTEHIIEHYNTVWDLPSVAENARASVIGKVTRSPRYIVRYKGEVICDAEATALTCGLQYTRPTTATQTTRKDPEISSTGHTIQVEGKTFNFSEVLHALISDPNHASKGPAIRHYDKNVIGNTLVEPGEADAGVIAPLQDLESHIHQGTHPGWELSESDRWKGVALAADGNGRYGRISPYWQGANAALEAMRNVVAVGATPRAITDCLNYGNPEIPDQLWALEEGVRGIADASKQSLFAGEPVPVISGNVSLYNGKPDGSAIDPTAIVSCIGILPDARKAVTMQLKSSQSALLLIGERKDELGGSTLAAILEKLSSSPKDTLLGSTVPQPHMEEHAAMLRFILERISEGNVLASHDISDGGLLLSLFEMTLPQRKVGGAIGCTIDLQSLCGELSAVKALCSETPGFLLEVPAEKAEDFVSHAKKAGVFCSPIGATHAEGFLRVVHADEVLLDEKLSDLHHTWVQGLEKALNRDI